MDMKKIVMAATLLSIVTGGEVSALAAKTTHQSVAKITHVKVTKHKVTGYTTAKSHIKLMKLKHGEKASATANKKGKFTVKVKSNNLTKLKFKIKATKPGMKARTYTHKVKKAVQAIDNSVTTETPASTAPVKPDAGKNKPQEKPHREVVMQMMSLKGHFEGILKEAQKKVDDAQAKKSAELKKDPKLAHLNDLQNNLTNAKEKLNSERAKPIPKQDHNKIVSLTSTVKTYSAQVADADSGKKSVLQSLDNDIQKALDNKSKINKVLTDIENFLNGKSTDLPSPVIPTPAPTPANPAPAPANPAPAPANPAPAPTNPAQ